MNVHIVFILTICFTYSFAHFLEPVVEKVVHLQTSVPPSNAPGIWRKKLIWKARWVQEWKSAKAWKPVWRKVWSPVEIREWVPVPRPPPQFHKIHPVPSPPTPSEPPSYEPPQSGPPSTPLLPIADGPSSPWPSAEMHDLLDSYHTIREPPDNGYQYPKPGELQNPSLPENDRPNSESFPPFLEPPKKDAGVSSFKVQNEYQSPQQSSQLKDPPFKQISPYAAKLAQAVLREKFNQSLNPTERPSGLTDVIYKPIVTSTTTKQTPTRFIKSATQTTTENPSNLYIVTPVSFL